MALHSEAKGNIAGWRKLAHDHNLMADSNDEYYRVFTSAGVYLFTANYVEYLGFVFTDLDARVAEVLLEGLNLITTHPVTQSAVPVSIARSVPIERQRAHTTRAQSLYIESTVSRLQELPPLSTVPAELLVPQLPDVYIAGERVCIYIFETSDWVSAQATVIRTRICSDYQNIHLRRTASNTVILTTPRTLLPHQPTSLAFPR